MSAVLPATDAQLMTRVAGGDADAFELLYDRYHVRAFALATRIAGRVGVAEEATQEAFLALWRGAHRYDPTRGELGAWLLTLVRHRSIDALRRKGASPFPAAWTDEALATLPSADDTAEQALANEAGREARRWVATLPQDQREVIGLAYFGGWSQQEIAAGTGLPLGTVKSRARLGLSKLRVSAAG